MQMKRICFLPIVTALVLVSSVGGCSEDDGKVPVVITAEVTDIAVTTAISGGTVSDDGGSLINARGVCWSTSPNPTIKDSKTNDGTGAGSFTSAITGLVPDTDYFVRAYASNKKGTAYGSIMTFRTAEGVADSDGNYYPMIRIGNYEWMAENLKTTKFNDGSNIENLGMSLAAWNSNTSGAYCWVNNNEGNKDTHGALYNWFAVNTGKLCPQGWRVPSDDEWKYLEGMVDTQVPVGSPVWDGLYFRGQDAGKILKAKEGWPVGGNGTDDYDFTAIPAGIRTYDADYIFVGNRGYFWTSDSHSAENAFNRTLYPDQNTVWRYFSNKRDGLSVRCIRDAN